MPTEKPAPKDSEPHATITLREVVNHYPHLSHYGGEHLAIPASGRFTDKQLAPDVERNLIWGLLDQIEEATPEEGLVKIAQAETHQAAMAALARATQSDYPEAALQWASMAVKLMNCMQKQADMCAKLRKLSSRELPEDRQLSLF